MLRMLSFRLLRSRSCYLSLIALSLAGLIPHGVSTQTPHERNFVFEYSTTVKELPAGTKEVKLWLPIPHSDPYQEISGLQITSPVSHQILTAQYGNQMMYLKVKDPGQSGLTVSFRFNVKRREHINPLLNRTKSAEAAKAPADPDMTRWLQPDRLVPIDGKIKQWAQEVVETATAQTDLEKAQAIYNHVVSTVKYDKTGQGWGRGDIYYACDARRGNCTDFHAIFIGYCRALGIPARFAIGFPLPRDRGEGQVSGYHCWAEFYVKELGWVPVDASEAAKDPSRREYFFGTHDENRVEFSRGRDLVLNPQQKSDPLNYFVYPYVEADGKPLPTIEKTFKYRDLSQPQQPTRSTN